MIFSDHLQRRRFMDPTLSSSTIPFKKPSALHSLWCSETMAHEMTFSKTQ
jgi:hypothetical protein